MAEPLRLRTIAPTVVKADGEWEALIRCSDAGAVAGTVTVGGTSATVKGWAADGIRITCPVKAAGVYDVVVTTSDARTDTLTAALTYVSGTSPLGLIWQNLVDTFDGMTLPYNGTDHTLSADYQRIIEEARGSVPVLNVLFRGATLQETSSRVDKLRATFVLACYVAGIDDRAPNDPIDKVTREISAYLVTQLMADITRGGLAVNTDKDTWDHALIEYGPGDIEPVVLIECHVDYYAQSQNHFSRAG